MRRATSTTCNESTAMNKPDELELEAIQLYESIPKWARTAKMREFMRRLAVRLGWNQLQEVL